MRTRLVTFVFFLLVVLFPAVASAASDYDFSENWDSGWSSLEKINKNGWSCSSNSNHSYTGAFVDTYQRYSSPYSAHLGSRSSYYYSYDYCYLRYTFSTPTPGPGTLDFWYYCRYSSFNVRYSADGVNWTNTELHPNYTYVYGATKTMEIPAGTKYIEFWNYTRTYYYYYGVWIDNLVYTMAEVWISSIDGYDKTGDNAGILDLVANADTSLTSPVDKVIFEYKTSDMTSWEALYTDINGSNGWAYSWNTGELVDLKCQLRATAYVGSKTGPITVSMRVMNPIFEGFELYPQLDGQMIPLSAKFGKKAYSLTWPEDGWSSTNNGNYIQMVMNAGEKAPMAGSYTSYTTHFNYVYTGRQAWHSFKLLDGSSPYFRCIASGSQTNSSTGAQTYQLSGSQWSNVPAGVYQGLYVYYSNIYNYNTSNRKDGYYTSSGNIGVGSSPYWYSYSYYCCPTQATIGGESSYPTRVEFGYSYDKQTVVPVGEGVVSGDSAAINWDSTYALEDATVWFASRGYNGEYWGVWNFAPDSSRIVNRTDVTVTTSMGEGELTFDGVTRQVPFDVNIFVSWENPFPYSVGAAEFQLENPTSDRWRFENWSDSGDRFHNMVFTGESVSAGNTAITANYVRQYYLQTISDAPVAGPEDGFYDVGYRVVSTGQQLIINEPYRDRRFCIGWEAVGPGLQAEVAEAIFNISTKTTLHWFYRREFSLLVYNDQGQTSGSLPGWYEEGTELVVSVNQHITEETARQECRGYTAFGAITDGSTNSSGVFVLNAPTEVHWIWQDQYFVDFSTNYGSTSPDPGWYDSGSVLTIDAASPREDEWTRYSFVSWTGTGTGSVTYQGDQTAHQITVNSPITQTARWDIWHRLAVVAENGSLVDDPSGWYLEGSTVGIEADPPPAVTGERWVIEWQGNAPARTILRDPQNSFKVFVTLSEGATQLVRFYRQYLLTVVNPNTEAVVVPAPGYSWHYGGEPVEGNAQFATDHFTVSGYYATGSLVSGSEPYFSFIILEPTMISWQWTERGAPPVQFWNMPSELAAGTNANVSSSAFSDGTLAVAYFDAATNSIMLMTGDGANWSGGAIASDIPGVEGLHLLIDRDDRAHVAYYNSVDHNLYFVMPVDSPVGGSGMQVIAVDDLGDVGRSPSVAQGLSGEIYIAYLDSSLGQVKLATIAGGMITYDIVPHDGTAALYASLTIRPNDGAPVIAFYDAADRSLVCAFRDNGVWTVEEVDAEGIVGFFCKVATSPSGQVYIAYQDITVVNRPVVKVAHRDFYTWEIFRVDDAIAGFYLDMVLDAAARPHIISSNGWQLRYTRSTGEAWESLTIPNPYDLGEGIAMVMLPEGKPGVFFTSDGKLGYMDALASELVNVGETSDGIVPVDDPTTGDTGGGGGCFVATAAFGTMGVKSVMSLTCWRDAVLSASSCGNRLRDLYYSLSPSIATRSGRSFASALRRMLRF